MRIRKNAKVSSLQQMVTGSSCSSSGADDGGQLLRLLLQPHVCQLNQSPWDAPDSSLHFPLPHQEYSFTGTVSSFNDSGPAMDSLPMEEESEEEEKVMVNRRKEISAETIRKKKKGRKGVGTSSESSICDNHISNSSTLVNDNATGSGSASNRGRRKNGPASNPYEFYYYTGFGPSWRRRKGGGHNSNFSNVRDNISSIIDPATPSPDTSFPANNYNGDDGMDITEEEDDDESDGGKKRMRKPVKARSLKSLM